MLMPAFELHRPVSIEEAVALARNLIDSGQEFDWVSGGTDLIPNYKWHINTKPHVISLAGIEEMKSLTMTEIGAGVKLSQMEVSDEIQPLLKTAAGKVASSLIRKSATLGGNICLDTRCFWYNQSEDWRRSIEWCHKADCGTGADCRVIPNQNTLCVATYQGDMAASLISLGAMITLVGPEGIREMPIEDFFELDGMKKNVLQNGEFVCKVTFSEEVSKRVGAYKKLRVRETWDFPEAGSAASWIPGDLNSLRIGTTGIESIPRSHSKEIQQHANWNDEDSIFELSQAVQKSVKAVNNTILSPRYRKAMVSVLTRRAIEEII